MWGFWPLTQDSPLAVISVMGWASKARFKSKLLSSAGKCGHCWFLHITFAYCCSMSISLLLDNVSQVQQSRGMWKVPGLWGPPSPLFHLKTYRSSLITMTKLAIWTTASLLRYVFHRSQVLLPRRLHIWRDLSSNSYHRTKNSQLLSDSRIYY